MSYTIPIVEKTFRVLGAIGTNGGAVSMHQLARSLDIAPSSCFRIIRTLQDQGWIAEKRTGGWELSVGLVRLLDGLTPVQRLIDASRGPLDDLVERTGLSGKLSVRQGDNAVTILRGESPAAFSMSGRIGAAYPLGVGSSGAALCGDMTESEIEQLIKRSPASAWANQSPAQFRQRAAAARAGKPVLDRGSYSPHVHTLSHAIRGGSDREIVGAVTLIGLANDLPEKSLPAVQRAIVAAVNEIEATMNTKGPRR
jgi:DNA-binding IclR family transcriptional regulator